ncbi:MAG: phosphotransferase [Gammaproteobacteria bacterium]|nr:phosphotransferase [Gammaproteobacteria bacterium]
MSPRRDALLDWLQNDLQLAVDSLQPASADASFRYYFRAHIDGEYFVVMDAPPEHEPIDRFLEVADALQAIGVHSPEILHFSKLEGFILMEDLGATTFLEKLPLATDELYSQALQALVKIQSAVNSPTTFSPPLYSQPFLEQEMDLFEQWYAVKHLGCTLSPQQQETWHQLKTTIGNTWFEQPQVWVHRDYHSRNLMVTENRSPGVIDFQDMMLGPITYDLASLFKDCYIQWPRTRQLAWLRQWQGMIADAVKGYSFSEEQFIRWYDFTGLQRHLKVLGIFCRLHYRDGKPQYLEDLPLVRRYVTETLTEYPELNQFAELFQSLPHHE